MQATDGFGQTLSVEEPQYFVPAVLTAPHYAIDGGQAIVGETSDTPKVFIRVACVTVQQDLKFPTVIENYEFAATIARGKTTLQSELLTFSYNTVSLEEATSKCRRSLELMMCEKILESIQPGSLVLLDGTLATQQTDESKKIKEILAITQQKNVVVAGLAKQSVMRSDAGEDVLQKFTKEHQKRAWTKIHTQNGFDTYIAKLHPHAQFSFRIDISHMQALDPAKIFAQLSLYSDDAVFLGYPYSLVKADKHARVTNQAAEQWALRNSLHSKTPHAILDSMEF